MTKQHSVGYQVGGQFKRQGVSINSEAMVRGMVDALSAEQSLLSEVEMERTLVNLKKRIMSAQYEKQQTQL